MTGDSTTDQSPSSRPSTDAAASSQRGPWLLALLVVALVTFAVFARAVGFEFLLWDDDIQLTANPTLRRFDWATAWQMFTHGYAIRYQPLSWVSSALLVRAGGMTASLFHAYNVVLHTLSAVLLAMVLRRLLLRLGAAPTELAHTIVAPALGALVFALHPLRAEPVAWATGWRYCQSVVLMLGATLFYLRTVDRRSVARSVDYWLSLLLFIGSALSYPFCLEWPLALWLLDVFVLRRNQAWRDKLPFVGVALAALAASVAIRLSTEVDAFAPASLETYGVLARAMKAAQVCADATWRALLPVDLQPVYWAPFHPWSVRAVGSAAALIALTGVLVHGRRRHPILLALWLIHLALLGAKLGLLESGHVEAADRFTYPAGVAWAGLATCGFVAAGRRQLTRKLRVPLAVVLLAVFSTATFRHLAVWKNDLTFFRAGLAGVGNSGLRDDMLWRLALAYWRDDQPMLALPLLDEAIERRPSDLRIRLIRAGLYRRMGRETEARLDLDAAVRLTGATTPEEAARALRAFVQPSP
jgi:protein O-mannosyl-transferase